jgi:Ras-related protein Rab-1A
MDTGGQEKYNAQNRTYYKRADCCVLVYDVTNKDSFNAIENFYVKEINNICKENIKVILVGNKTDLKDKRKISNEDGADLATKYKFYFKETSCELNSNVADAFETIISMTHNEMMKNKESYLAEKLDIKILKENNEKKFKKKCCLK